MDKAIILVHKVFGLRRQECFLDISKIKAVENPLNNDFFNVYFDNDTWTLKIDDFDYLMSKWCPNYKEILKAKEHDS